MQDPLLLQRGIWGGFALCSFGLAGCFAYDPTRAWRVWFGVHGEQASVSILCFAGALVGEGALQLAACLDPLVFSFPALCFMVPYKLSSVGLLLGKSLTTMNSPDQVKALRFVALNWLAPLGIIYMAS
ncbi:hypothetical protein BASA81_005148 [Batrachochytrium salamandrivorans]|nr:hypothetical protein BASA81_005148 [Batrachochytrium salamandrivorans]